MAINKVVYNGTTLIDITDSTATAPDVAEGKYFYTREGIKTLGTGSGGGGTDFIVTLSYDSQSEMWTPDKTLAEIAAAYSAEKNIATYAYNSVDDMIQASGGYYDDGSEEFWYWVDNSDGDASGDYTISSNYYLDSNGVTLDETIKSYRTSPSDAIPSDVANGKIFYNANGQQTGTSTAITPTGTISVTQNGTVDVTNYATANVNVSGGGGSAWTKVAETSYQISTTSTSATTFATWSTGHSELWTSNKWVWVRIRDTAGKRNGYFYGSDNIYSNTVLKNGSSATSVAITGRLVIRYYNDSYSTTTSNYGVYTGSLYNDGNIVIMTRYNSSNSRTINGTYKVEVYLLDPAGGVPIFE